MASKSSEIFDFGFTAVTESELESSQTVEVLQARLDKLYKSITPLLNNLKKNPEKDYIHWPNRVAKVEEFERMIAKIVSGD